MFQQNENGNEAEDIEIIEKEHVEEVNDEEDEELNIGDGWMLIFDKIDKLDEEESQDNCHFIDRAANALFVNEVKNMMHSDGKEHREKYPYPDDGYDTSFPQEKLKGIRTIKCSSSSLFPPEIEPFDEFTVNEMTIFWILKWNTTLTINIVFTTLTCVKHFQNLLPLLMPTVVPLDT